MFQERESVAIEIFPILGETATTIEPCNGSFDDPRRVFLTKRTEADFQAWHDQQAWTAEKYRRFDRVERMAADWRPGA